MGAFHIGRLLPDDLARQGSSAWGYGSLWFQKGEALRGLGRIEAAQAAYAKAVESDGGLSEAGLALKTFEEPK